uniref:Uncharacterized protein n=1 Tax=Anguilla anguilla TaxID=7936 RepID=A0A0E9QK06_ANGAN
MGFQFNKPCCTDQALWKIQFKTTLNEEYRGIIFLIRF